MTKKGLIIKKESEECVHGEKYMVSLTIFDKDIPKISEEDEDDNGDPAYADQIVGFMDLTSMTKEDYESYKIGDVLIVTINKTGKIQK